MSNRGAIAGAFNNHWFCIVPLLPFAVMFTLHCVLGLSDAMGGVQVDEPEPTDGEVLYNYVMVAAFYGGVAFYFAHLIFLIDRSRTAFLVKLLAILVIWLAILIAFQ